MGIFVQVPICGSIDDVWAKTQTPGWHQRWDLRFTTIDYLPRLDDSQPQGFRYTTQIGFGLRIAGDGETVAIRESATGERTSALKFWSDDPKSLIKRGSGYWKYRPAPNGQIEFLTWYDYQTRFGTFGRIIDRILFRPLLGWATAWSFDSLRLWIEKGIDPGVSRLNALIHALTRISLALIWIYQGFVPKLLFHQKDELTMLIRGGVMPSSAMTVLNVFGLAEVVLGIALIVSWRKRWTLLVSIPLMFLATVGVAVIAPEFLGAAFNPVTLNFSILILALNGYLVSGNLPSAGNCLRKPENGQEGLR